MTRDVKAPLRNLAGELGVSLQGLDDDQMNAVAVRFIVANDLSARAMQAIVDSVRKGGRGGGTSSSATPPPALPKRASGFRFNATEADRKQRLKMADQHLAETRRTGLWLAPRRPEAFPAGKPHPSCLAAVRDGLTASVCERPACQWLLDKDDPYIDAWLDRDD